MSSSSSSAAVVDLDEDDDDLRQRLASLCPGDPIPPVTNTTRPLLRAKLDRMMKTAANGNAKDRAEGKGAVPKKNDAAAKKNSTAAADNIGGGSARDVGSIATFVFFDLEATGLAGSYPKARITELSLVAVGAEELAKLHRQMQDQQQSSPPLPTPRVVNKLSMCFYPGVSVPFGVSNLTGLDNFNLEDQKRFDSDAASAVGAFLGRLAKPVCLVAHNGNRYDFPLLRAELAKCRDAASPEHLLLPDDLLCADSLTAMREVFKEEENATAAAVREEAESVRRIVEGGGLDEDMMEAEDDGDAAEYLDDIRPINWGEDGDGEASALAAVTPTKCYMSSSSTSPFALPVTPPASDTKKKRPRFEDDGGRPRPCFKNLAANFSALDQNGGAAHAAAAAAVALAPGDPVDMREENEVTPDKYVGGACAMGPPNAPKRQKRSQQQSRREAASGAGVGAAVSARKRLDFGASASSSPKSYSLENLHRHLFPGRAHPAHCAEADCLALMRICAAKRRGFLDYLGRGGAAPFDEQGGKKLW